MNYKIDKLYLTAVRSSAIAFPLEWYKVGQVPLESMACGCRITPVMHFATPIIF